MGGPDSETTHSHASYRVAMAPGADTPPVSRLPSARTLLITGGVVILALAVAVAVLASNRGSHAKLVRHLLQMSAFRPIADQQQSAVGKAGPNCGQGPEQELLPLFRQ